MVKSYFSNGSMRELLIIQPSSLADIVHGLQVTASLKAQQPDWRVSWIVRDVFAPLVRSSSVVDQIFVFRRMGGARGFIQLMREVRAQQFDVVMDFQGLLRSGLMVRWTRARRKLGRADAREGAGFFYGEKIAATTPGPHHSLEVLLQFLVAVGARPELHSPLRFRDFGQLNLAFMRPRNGRRPVLMFPESRHDEKRWPEFAQLSSLLVRESGRKVVWAGTNYLPCKEAFPDGAFVNLTGNTSLISLAALITHADWVVSNDTGPLQLAAALGVKTLGIFGPTDPRLSGPYPLNSATNFYIQAPVGDMRLLSARDVYARLKRRMDTEGGEARAPFPQGES